MNDVLTHLVSGNYTDADVDAAVQEITRLRAMIEYALEAPSLAQCLSVLRDTLAGGSGAPK